VNTGERDDLVALDADVVQRVEGGGDVGAHALEQRVVAGVAAVAPVSGPPKEVARAERRAVRSAQPGGERGRIRPLSLEHDAALRPERHHAPRAVPLRAEREQPAQVGRRRVDVGEHDRVRRRRLAVRPVVGRELPGLEIAVDREVDVARRANPSRAAGACASP
jgi:hypothetical protein